ncbi:MAG: hypothetical protein LBN00_03520 [Oscillospiraceae bacterium]|jgi:hypothetical protein|nr:hypothetical protein [Oscillospiraceae bacterium]
MKKMMLAAVLAALALCACAATPDSPGIPSETPAETKEIVASVPTPESTPTPTPTPTQITKSDLGFSQSGVYEIVENTEYSIDLDNDGKTETLCIVDLSHDDNYIINGKVTSVRVEDNMYISVNDVASENVGLRYIMNVYIIKRENGSTGIVISGDWMSDDYVTYTYAFDGTTAIEVDYENFYITAITENTMTLEGVVFLFSNQKATVDCVINDDFSLTYAGDGLIELTGFNGDREHSLVTKIELKLADITLPAGTKLFPKRTDLSTFVLCETETGATVTLPIEEKEDWEGGLWKVNGINENDLFGEENIQYAG